MRPIRSVSVLVPTFQGIEFLERVLDALAGQRLDLPWDLWVIDSSSTDGTWELLEARCEGFPVPLHTARIHQSEFDHGDTRNLLAARSAGDLLVFLTQDAIPTSPGWLATLTADFEDVSVGAAYCRNVPRADCLPLTRLFSADDPGYAVERRETRLPDAETYAAASPDQKRLLFNFNDVASAVRRELWERHPFPRTRFGEDVLMARGLLEAGHRVVYNAEATVEHSHDYDVEETFRRGWVDGRFNREWLGRTCLASEADVRALVQRFEREDAKAIGALGLEVGAERALLAQAVHLRTALFDGLHAGGVAARARHPATRMLSDPRLSLLFVVHGFPPDTWAGTEVATLNLARELQRRGHRCTVLARVPAGVDGPPDFDVAQDEVDGLRVLRMTNRLELGRLRDSYRNPGAEAAFREVLRRETPDLVHFQHLIHTSAGLVHVARELGLPTVVTCHDFWALCARVQMIRPDGVRCETNMGSGCLLCVKEQGLDQIERAARLDRADPNARGGLLTDCAREVAQGPGWSRLRRQAQEYVDMREREEYVPGAYAAADLLLSPSRFLREKHLETGRFDPHTFLFSDNGMRTDHIHALEKTRDSAGRVRFGFVGSLVWYKGGEVMVRAMQRLAGSRAVLNVYGAFDPEGDAHHAQLREAARGADVHFKGRFDNARLSEVHAEIDVLLVPSLWFENSPVTIHEAFLTRTPVLASGIGGMAEYVRDGVDGLHFAVGDDADLARKMRRFLDEPELLEGLSRNFPAVKTIEEQAAEMEFRYRALVCRERSPAAGPGELRGTAAAAGAGRRRAQAAYVRAPRGAEVEGAGA